MKLIRAHCVKCGERQNDKSHDQFNRDATEQAAHQWVLLQETQPAARRVVNSRCRESDEEVQEDTQNIGADASPESLSPKQAAGNRERNFPSKQDESLCKVQSPGNQAAHCDCQYSVPPYNHPISRFHL